MPREIDIKLFLQKADSIPVIDVRTPAEYKQGHIPTAHNIPLFSNKERKVVGTSYKQEGQQEALMKGLDFAGPKMTSFVQLFSRFIATIDLRISTFWPEKPEKVGKDADFRQNPDWQDHYSGGGAFGHH